jgi:electron transfer flavoprotein beta subunit
VELELASPRYASLPEMVRALRQDIEVWGATEISGVLEKLGLKGSPTTVMEIFTPPVRGGGAVFDSTENKEQAIQDFLDSLFEREQPLINELLSRGEG